jgi:hypothetical protein
MGLHCVQGRQNRAMPRTSEEPVLSLQALNRATLQRQLLLSRSPLSPAAAVERLAGLQHQSPNAPYWALWARLQRFDVGTLTRLMAERRLLRIALMRSTLHLVSAGDLLAFRPVLRHVMMRALMASHGRHLKGVDLEALAEEGRRLLCAEPLTLGQLGQRLAERWPGHDTNALAVAARCAEPLVHVPPAGSWNHFQNAWLLPADVWLNKPLPSDTSPDALILRYLAAFGPASAADIGTWSGLTALQEPLQRLAPRLRRFRDEEGRLLHDLPRAPRPDPDTPAPVRLIGEFDNLVLSHADRRRVMDEGDRTRIITANGQVMPCVLIDGRVAGTWKIASARRTATLTLTPLRTWTSQEREAVRPEAERALAFAAPEADRRQVDVARARD